jgi:putative transposase
MLKAFRYRISPTASQAILLSKHFGSVRFLYNLALETKQTVYATSGYSLSRYELQVQLKDLKNECEWLKEINSQSLQVALMNLDAAYLRFFKGQNDFPKYKKKAGRQSFSVPQSIKVEGGKLFIPKFREGIEIVLHRPFKGTIRQATVSKTPTGKYFVSILCETGEAIPEKKGINPETAVGIDLGISHFAITSDGQFFENPKYMRKAENRLRFVQRKFSKHKGKRTKHKLARLHEKVAGQRKDFLHKLSNTLVNNHDTLCLETLRVDNMLKNHCLAKSIQDAGWAMFVSMVEYKAEWAGKNVLRIGAFEASSKTCSNCGNINRILTLKDREWACGGCGVLHNRDVNAAINIKNFSLIKTVSGTDTENRGELPTLVGAMTREAHTL